MNQPGSSAAGMNNPAIVGNSSNNSGNDPNAGGEDLSNYAPVAAAVAMVPQVSEPVNQLSSLPLQQQQSKMSKVNSSAKLEMSESDVLAVSDIDLSLSGGLVDDDPGIIERSPGGRYVRFIEKLGSGAYKDVYRAYDTIEGIEVAWNQVNLAGIPKADKIRIINEVRLLEKLDHQNIISFYGSWVNREREQVVFVTEILSSGTLKSFIKKVQVIRWNVAKRWAIQILNGLLYLHSQVPPVSHRDLKCDNIFINGTSGDLRIGDLGLSTAISKSKALSVLGTPEFMAPELYDEKYDEKVDIYAFGMCMLEIFTKEVPYLECSNPAQIYKKVTNQIGPQSLVRIQSREAREFILLCIDADPMKRPTAAELLNHSFLSPTSDDAETEILVLPRVETLPAITESSGKSASSNMRVASDENIARGLPPQTSAGEKSITPVNSSQNLYNTINIGDSDSDQALSTDDTYHGMQDAETQMKPPQVLMGRDLPRSVHDVNNDGDHIKSNSSSQYVVAAECMDEVVVDNMMKLIISIPIENETQHVQFDFHLVEDDPVQVAREMVTELQIPQQAILEVSEAISGLARDARVNQGKQIRQAQENGGTIGESSNSNIDRSKRSLSPQPTKLSETQFPPPSQESTVTEGTTSKSLQVQSTSAVQSLPELSEEDLEDAMDEEATDELRRLEVEYRKGLERTTKAYDTRMENLKRSKSEKQAQHLKLLEKHEREMEEFDKRLKQAERDQSKRLEKLEEDWNMQKEDFMHNKRKEAKEKGEKLLTSTSNEKESGKKLSSKPDENKSNVSLLSMSSAQGVSGKSDKDISSLDRSDR